jgi:hypothetical protein
MGLLAPLYILGALAIGIPILLHLIRRTPQGRHMFSSLMFLTPSPPRLTKRSRISNLLLLLIRAAAVVLLALAFARPFFHWGENQPQLSSGRRVLFLVDVSASMRRPNLWADAKTQVEAQLDDIQPADEVGLYFFDRQLHPGMTFDQWNQADPAQRLPLFRAALAQAAPGWSATRLGDSLAAAEDLASENNSKAGDLKKERTIILVTDMQEGANAQSLQGHELPKDVWLKKIPPVAARSQGNASLQWIASDSDGGPAATAPATAPAPGGLAQTDGTLRVRVENSADAAGEQFTLAWQSDKGPTPDAPVSVYVPPGRSQIVRMPLPADRTVADRLVLSGDNCDFDNTLFLVQPQQEVLHLVYLGDESADDVNGPRFYLRRALFDSPLRKLELVARKTGDVLTPQDVQDARLVVVTRLPTDDEIAILRKYVGPEVAGDVLWVGKDAETVRRAGALIGRDLQVTEAGGRGTDDYALLSRVDLSDPVFAPFTDARFADFSKIHFWKHRQINWTAADMPAGWAVRASFDNGDPYLISGTGAEKGSGSIYIMTAGWTPAESQLALSSKFLPMMEQLVRRRDAITLGSQFAVGDSLPLPANTSSVTGPDGKTAQVDAAKGFNDTNQPGIYHLKAGNKSLSVAVNLSPDESRTKPGNLDDLAQWGVAFTSPQLQQIAAERQKIQLKTDLENRQKVWRWLLLCVLGLLAVETVLAGRISRQAMSKKVTA